MSEISVFVQARPHPNGSGVYAEHRCRCGMCFDADGRAVSVTAYLLERRTGYPMGVFTDVDAAPAATDAPQAETPTAPEPEAAKADAPASETDKTAAKADKKAG